MLSTGIRTPLGIKITGPDSKELRNWLKEIEMVLRKIKGTRSVFAERIEGGHYLDIEVDRDRAPHAMASRLRMSGSL